MLKHAVVAVAALCVLARDVAADPIISGKPIHDGIGIEVGAIVHGGFSELADDHADLAPSAQGIVIRDRNGTSSRMVIGLVIAIAGALAASGPKSVESKSYRSGDYIVTETKTTHYSEEEKAQMRENTNRAIGGLFQMRYSDFELQLFSRDRFGSAGSPRGDSSGYRLNFLVGGGDASIAFETGFGFGVIDSIVPDAANMPTRVVWKYLGMPFRVSRVFGPVRAALTYEWNWLKYGVEDQDRFVHAAADGGMQEVRTVSHPWHLDLSTMIARRVTLGGGITAQELRLKLGYHVTAGIFF